MLKVTVIGWYGTETLGDRGILSGLISLLAENGDDFSIRLGSIYPFFSERTLLEDEVFHRHCAADRKFDITLFDSSRRKELDAAINASDAIIVGGGPLMGLLNLFMLEYAFAKAKKLKKKTLILGCGVGPMRKKIYEKSMCNLVGLSDLTIFRDNISLTEYRRLASSPKKSEAAIDPAVFAAQTFRKKYPGNPGSGSVIVCLREFPTEYKISPTINENTINRNLVHFIRQLREQSEYPIRLLPMHYFEVGNDDRFFLNRLAFNLHDPEIIVENKPQTLFETLKAFTEAPRCVGMRFHSVVLQTFLNGNNIILDYTDPQTGKIGNFLRQINAEDFYRNSYRNLQIDNNDSILSFPSTPFHCDNKLVNGYRQQYVNAISKTLYGEKNG